jgi:hypothetical protein
MPPLGASRCMKTMRRSPDERLRIAADCLSRLVWGLRPDPMPKLHGRNNLQGQTTLFFEDGPGPVLEPVGGEFQPSFEIVHPDGGAHLFPYYILFSYKEPSQSPPRPTALPGTSQVDGGRTTVRRIVHSPPVHRFADKPAHISISPGKRS